MRKAASILLLSLLVFNWTGYELYISIMQYYADETLVDNINKNNFAEDELISIKVAVPYLYFNTGDTDFKRFDGNVEIAGVQYRYVKRRLYNDSIEMLCMFRLELRFDHLQQRLKTLCDICFTQRRKEKHAKAQSRISFLRLCASCVFA